MKKLVGDTLIEVALAIGIFSMVAVAVVSVVSASTADAQSALETTVTREVIDAQAEALRFIQSSYIAGGRANLQNSADSDNLQKYATIWDEIADHALCTRLAGSSGDRCKHVISESEMAEVLRFNPETCQEIYENEAAVLNSQHAFIINPRRLGTKVETGTEIASTDALAKAIVVDNGGAQKFFQTTTYPRVLYGALDADTLEEPGAILDTNSSKNLSRVEGIFIVAVKDPGSVVVSTNTSGGASIDQTKSAYYDFYIRTCWYNPGAEKPSTISTVIRLQDPAAITY